MFYGLEYTYKSLKDLDKVMIEYINYYYKRRIIEKLK